eukprot:CAMPEP_0168326060 /NCGR_PEP_ID=MMETSP0213-20121227/5070_1 /TAXON_ID=151035 /ORGANISM="Euplotes harpa, Strain FSP1.4" /LENGTH=110 /DNA_ID=CAMNT_0008328687 /DNA_START=18 /DNA_END=350 /DNA_ORIENTATION=+
MDKLTEFPCKLSPRQMKLDRLRQTKKMSPEEYELERMRIYGDDYVPSKHSPFFIHKKMREKQAPKLIEAKLVDDDDDWINFEYEALKQDTQKEEIQPDPSELISEEKELS